MKLKRVLFLCAVFGLAAMIVYSGHRLWDINQDYAAEAAFHNQVLQYKPALQTALEDGGPSVNPSIADLRAKYPDVVGWLTIPGTAIDYPFAQSTDNDYYLHRDLDGKSLTAGTLFMDFRDQADFTGFNTVIYGHDMKNGSMFGTLQQYSDQAFANTKTTGTISLADKTFAIEFFAFVVVRPDDAEIYDPMISQAQDRDAFLDYVKTTARHYRDIDLTVNDHFVTLSTCTYEFSNARMVLVGKLVRK